MNVALYAVSDEGSHCDTAMLDLGLTEPSDGELIRLAPKSRVRHAKGIEVSNDGVELRAQLLKVGLQTSMYKSGSKK